MNATILKISWAKALGMLIASLLSVQSLACHRSVLNPTTVSWDGINQEYVIGLRLDVGSGRTGVQYGADGDTRSITFAFYKACTTITVNSYSPSQITGAFTNCTMPGMNLGPQGMPFNSQATIIYLDPGYYGIPPCVNQPFACISTTALCGNVATNTYNFTFRTSIMPDSIRVFGVEGNGNPLAGCYPDVDMTFALSESVSGPMPFNCLPPQQVPAGPGCLGVVPDFRPLAPLPPTCSSINNGFLTQVPAPGTVVGGLGSNLTVSFFAPNGNVLALTCTFSASVADLSPPTVTCPGNFSIPATSGCNTATLNNLLYLGSITDNCDPNPAWIQSPPAGTVINSSAIVRFIGTDAYANADTCSFQLNVADILPPTLSCPPSQTVSLDALCQYALTDFLSQAVVADACDPNPTLVQSPLPGTVYTSPGNQVVTLTATDDGGNTSTCAMALQVVQPPTQVVCPGASSLPLSANCDATLPDFTAMATYQYLCQTIPIVVVQSPGPGQLLSGAGATTVTLTATDSAGGQSFCGFVVSRVDNQAPSLTCPPGQTLSLDANCQVSLPDFRPGANASDNCTTSPTLLQSPGAGTVISGATTVTLTANDAAGNTSSCGVAVTVADQMPPNLTCPPGQAFALDANCQAALPDFRPGANASDNCTSIPTLIQSPSAGTVVSGPTTVTLTANDAAGNSTSCSIAVTATDLTPPGLTCPSNIALTPTYVTCQIPVFWSAPNATDNCGATLTASHQPGDVFPVGLSTVTYTAQDPEGNTTTCTFSIHVMPPSLSGTTVVAPSQPCQGDSATLTAISGASQYLWSTGETSASIQATAIGWYWVDILLGPGCVTRDSVFLTFAPLPQPLVFQSGNQACTGAFATYQWYLNGQVLPGENAACTPLGLSGSYSVSVTDTNGCAAMSAGMLLVDVVNPAAWDVAVHPNPADQYLVLEIPFLPEGSLELALYDMTGRMVLERFLECRSGSHQVETAALPSGQYLARLRGGDGKSRATRIMVWHP